MTERGWRIASAILWYVTILAGYFSREVYDGVRHLARVNPLTAFVNNPWFVAIGLSYVVGRFVRAKGLSLGMSPTVALYDGIVYGLISLVAFSALPLPLILTRLPSNARILYLGYALKLAAFMYLLSLFTRYLVSGDDKVFFRMRGAQRVGGDTR
jgi:hypothetical protein